MPVQTISLPGKILFGTGSLNELGKEAALLGKKAIIVTYPDIKKVGILDKVIANLKTNGVEVVVYDKIEPNPRSTTIDAGVQFARQENIDVVIGLGGGSAMDAAKGLAVAYAGGAPVWDYVIRQAKAVPQTPPLIQIPTMAGTGSEINAGAVISNWELHDKRAMVTNYSLAKVAIIDPEITLTVPVSQVRAGGVDIFCHIVEPYLTDWGANQLTDGIREATMRTVVENLPLALENPKDIAVRTKLSWASTLAMSSLMNLGGGGGVLSMHDIEHAVSGVFDVTHGVGLAALLPAWMKFTLPARPKRFESLGKNVFGEANGIIATEAWLAKVGLYVKLRDLGASLDKAEEIGLIAEKGGWGLKWHPIPMNAASVAEIYRNAY
ncbi:MAG: iron-containing alcohol dehydrogenase [Dehalococcoidales bacterium]|nr:iron-containing alcohol dehydrogenase [Dehalococcoidales bacterium]